MTDEEMQEVETPTEVKNKSKKKFIDTRIGALSLTIISFIISGLLIIFIKEPLTPKLLGLRPLPAIFLISVILSIAVTLVYKFLTDQTLMKELKKDLKKYQKQMKEHRGDTQKMSEVQKKAMSINMKYMRQTMKPMMITMLPFLLIFYWLRSVYVGTILIPLSFWSGHLGWIGTYIIFSMVFTTLFRKLLKVA